jgi:twitching motility two-component system response regulator PilH
MATFLIVEDEANIRQFVRANLAARGHQVIQAESAEDGLQKMRDQRPDAMLLDIKLPGMSGWDLLTIMANDENLVQIPVIVMTATPANIQQAENDAYSNVVGKLVKPVGAADLVRAVQKVVG